VLSRRPLVARREHAELEWGVVLVKRHQHLLAVRSKGVGIKLMDIFDSLVCRARGSPFLSRLEKVEIDNGLPNDCLHRRETSKRSRWLSVRCKASLEFNRKLPHKTLNVLSSHTRYRLKQQMRRLHVNNPRRWQPPQD
jgi:hypothetical protein